MFANMNKALVAVVMGLIYLINHFFGTEVALSESAVSGAVAVLTSVLTPLLVYLVPNKPED